MMAVKAGRRTQELVLSSPTRLLKALEATNLTATEICRQAGISAATFTKIKNSPLTINNTHKARRGLAASLARLSILTNVPAKDVLKQVGLDDSVAQAKARKTVAAKIGADFTLQLLELDHFRGSIPVGFVDGKGDLWERRNAFGRGYCDLLLTRSGLAVGPRSDAGPGRSVHLDWKAYDSVDQAIGALTRSTPEIVAICGVSPDLPGRVSRGIGFVPIPVHITMAGIVAQTNSQPPLSWIDILARDEQTGSVKLVVLEAEAGHHLASDILRYPDAAVVRLANPTARDVYDLLKPPGQEASEAGKIPSYRAAFIADVMTCRSFFNDATFRAGDYALIEFDQYWTPRISMGIGVRADSPVFRKQLIHLTRSMLFRFGALQVAGMMLDHLFKGEPSQEESPFMIRRADLESLGRRRLNRFRWAVFEMIKRKRESAEKSDNQIFAIAKERVPGLYWGIKNYDQLMRGKLYYEPAQRRAADK